LLRRRPFCLSGSWALAPSAAGHDDACTARPHSPDDRVGLCRGGKREASAADRNGLYGGAFPKALSILRRNKFGRMSAQADTLRAALVLISHCRASRSDSSCRVFSP
jgi:hypothetical protein